MKKKKPKYPKYLEQDTDAGYTDKQCRKIMTKMEYKAFCKWMNGQTMCLDRVTKQPVVYAWDVDRFLKLVREGKQTYWD